ncbi:CoA transferase [Aeromicrobium sp. YIM 150415]|uniref:CaiB/BaiF CoA transferase family protein n=1 Tax=Aeromicrobium sp. YIM 150415 TaxID=2803912 RepID=UPI0019631181|nr:CoA transferase [Aeromicrobium sp. YIM 150415]MBM9461819.1 CoA transferase [Aeromicrobium sp. YIM 150415]MBM9463167.1 CoA transferase [Aeromicrobium sp. YIM 150415]
MPSAPQPLSDIRIIDLTRALAGPFCTTLLADLGADVIKVESLGGDMIRSWGPYDGDISLYHLSVNRNKRSIAVDLHSEDGRELLHDLVRDADVLVENFRPGVLDDLGFGPSSVARDYPDLVVASVSGFGPRGPLRDDPCFDQIAQGMAGLMSVTGTPDGEPMRSGLPIADLLSGMFTAIGVAGALFGRERGGGGSRVETSLLESVLGVMTFQAQRYLNLGEIPPRVGNEHPVIAPYGAFRTEDAPVNLAVATDGQWKRLCEILQEPSLLTDPRFADGRSRSANRHALKEVIEQRLTGHPSAHWLERFRTAELPAGPIHDLAGVFDDIQIQALEMVADFDHPHLGPSRTLRGPWRIDDVPMWIRRPAPGFGEHTVEVLTEFGLSPERIDALLASDRVRAGEQVSGRAAR